MQQSARGVDDLAGFGHRLHRAGFVVGQHHRNQRRRPALEHRAQTVQIQQTRTRDADDVDRLGWKPPAGEHRGVLDSRNHQPFNRQTGPPPKP